MYSREFWQHRSTAQAAIPADNDLVSLARSPCFAALLPISVPRGRGHRYPASSRRKRRFNALRWASMAVTDAQESLPPVDAPGRAQNKEDIILPLLRAGGVDGSMCVFLSGHFAFDREWRWPFRRLMVTLQVNVRAGHSSRASTNPFLSFVPRFWSRAKQAFVETGHARRARIVICVCNRDSLPAVLRSKGSACRSPRGESPQESSHITIMRRVTYFME
jgi:hypothetical protein